MVEIAIEYLGDDIGRLIAEYREQLAGTAVEMAVNDRPSVTSYRRSPGWNSDSGT